MTSSNVKYSPNLVLTAILSGGLTIGISLVYILLCVTFIVFRFNCDAISTSTSTAAGYFWQTIFKVYALKSSCDEAMTIQTLTHESTVLILVAVTLAISIISLIFAVSLVSIVQDESRAHHVTWLVYTYIVCCIVSLIVDVTTTAHFGVDYSYLTSLLKDLAPDGFINYQIDVLRQGAFLFMILAMKGFITPIITCVFLVLLVIYLMEYQELVSNSEHSIHKVGVLNAFEQKKRDEDNWLQPEPYKNSPFSRGPQINSVFVDDDSPPRSPVRRVDPPRSDYYANRSFDRSDSWTRAQNIPQNQRVFSYLEDPRRPAPPKVPQTHSPHAPVEKPSPWRRDPWPQVQGPQVPAPDYSPTQPRRLKSALKPGYM